MVDFNNETTVTRPAVDIMRVLILEKRENVIVAFGFYKKKESSGVVLNEGALQSSILELFLDLRAAIKRRSPEKYEWIEKKCNSKKHEDLLEAYCFIDDYLDEVKLTRIDTSTPLGGNIIERNKAHGVPI